MNGYASRSNLVEPARLVNNAGMLTLLERRFLCLLVTKLSPNYSCPYRQAIIRSLQANFVGSIRTSNVAR